MTQYDNLNPQKQMKRPAMVNRKIITTNSTYRLSVFFQLLDMKIHEVTIISMYYYFCNVYRCIIYKTNSTRGWKGTLQNCKCRGFPSSSDDKASACNAGDPGSIPGLGRSPGEGNDNPLQYSCLENPHGQQSLVGYSPWGPKQLDTTEWLTHIEL